MLVDWDAVFGLIADRRLAARPDVLARERWRQAVIAGLRSEYGQKTKTAPQGLTIQGLADWLEGKAVVSSRRYREDRRCELCGGCGWVETDMVARKCPQCNLGAQV